MRLAMAINQSIATAPRAKKEKISRRGRSQLSPRRVPRGFIHRRAAFFFVPYFSQSPRAVASFSPGESIISRARAVVCPTQREARIRLTFVPGSSRIFKRRAWFFRIMNKYAVFLERERISPQSARVCAKYIASFHSSFCLLLHIYRTSPI